MGNGSDHPLTFETAPPQAGHLGVETGLIYEHEVGGLVGREEYALRGDLN